MDFRTISNEALDRIVRDAALEDRSPAARARAVAEWIARDPGRHHAIDALAERAAMSARSLERWFARELRTTPAGFVRAARLALARRLLEASSLSVKAIAQRCGYGNPERMRREFQRTLGTSPRSYAAGARVPPKEYGLDVCLSGSNLLRTV